MAIYHTHIKTFSRTRNDSSIAAAAYRGALWLFDSRTGKRHDYRRRKGVEQSRIVAPGSAPDWAFDPEKLWAAAEAAEHRGNSTVAREFEVALPCEFDAPQRAKLTSALARALVARYGFAVQASIHEPSRTGSRNWHVHILATTRRMGSEGLGEKTRELDGGPSGRAEVNWTRRMVADTINQHLEEAEIAARVDHRTLEAQADAALAAGNAVSALELTREPTQHLGKNATALERKGERTKLGTANEAITHANGAAFDQMLVAYQAAGRVVATPEGHSAERARRDRRREAPRASKIPAHPQILVAGDLPQVETPPPNLRTPAGRRRAAREALREAHFIWMSDQGLGASLGVVFVHTARVLRHQGSRLRAYIDHPPFAVDLRELVRRMKRFAHDAGRLLRRKAASANAQARLAAAHRTLEAFDEQHPKPALWSRSEWSKRRSRRVAEVTRLMKEAEAAREATGETAARAYGAQTRKSAEALESWSETLLDRYGIYLDEEDALPPERPADEPPPPPVADDSRSGSGDIRQHRPRF